MKLYSIILTIVGALALAYVYRQQADTLALALCLLLIAHIGAFLLTDQFATLLVQAGLSFGLIGAASYTLASTVWWLGTPLLFLFSFSICALAALLYSWAWSKVKRVFRGEALIVNNGLAGDTRAVEGPAWILPLPILQRLTARIPLYQLEHEIELTGVNAYHAQGRFDDLAQNIERMVIELSYHFPRANYWQLHSLPNRDTYFSAAARTLGKSVRAAKLDKDFWLLVWQAVLRDYADRAVRKVVHKRQWSPTDARRERDMLAAQVFERLSLEVQQMGLELDAFTIKKVTLDDEAATHRTRERMVAAQARAQEITLAGEAQVRIRASLFRELLAEAKLAGVPLSPRLLERIAQRVLLQPSSLVQFQDVLNDPFDRITELDTRSDHLTNEHSLN